MTENKAINEIIKEVCSGCYGSDEEPHRCSTCGFKMAKDALKEIQQYRAIGTVEDIREIYSLCKILQNVVKDYSAIGTIEEFKALKEKNLPKKPLDDGMRIPFSYYCPNCKEELSDDGYKPDEEYCANCGQHILIEN